MNDEMKANVSTVEKDEDSNNFLHVALVTLRSHKPNDRSEKDRRYAVTITMLEQVYAYFNTYVIRNLD